MAWIGGYRHRFELLEETQTADDAGGYTLAWSVNQKRWGRIRTKRTLDKFTDAIVEQPNEIELETRYNSEIAEVMRVRYPVGSTDGTVYEIVGVENIDMMNKAMVLTIKKLRLE